MAKKVLVPIADGTEEIEAVSIIDTLRRAGAEVTVASVTEKLNIVASRGVRIDADAMIGECVDTTYDLVVLPGGMPGATHLRDSKELTEILKQQQQQGRLYGAICASPAVVLEHHGLIGGRKATCYPSFAKDLSNADASGSRTVVDGTLITGQGPGTAIEFALKLVELLFGSEKAAEIAKAMIVRI
ncbi:MAG: DJ-1/PfpI family protein [Sedimentisphaerales bacterium]|nr:DJ-1/PfpI family protein [Sedimentisphaerales bacterium]